MCTLLLPIMSGSPPPQRTWVLKNVTCCPLPDAVWGEWHLKNSTSPQNPSSVDNYLLFLSVRGRCLFLSIFPTDIYGTCSTLKLCTWVNLVSTSVCTGLNGQGLLGSPGWVLRITQHLQHSTSLSFNPACSKCQLHSASAVGILETMPTVNTSLMD